MSATVAAVLALLGVLAYAVAQVRLHLSGSGYSPIRHALSDYGVGPTVGWYRASGAATTVAQLALAVALVASGRWALTSTPILLLGLATLARVAVLVFPTDLPGQSRTTTGRLHLLAAIVQFAAVYSLIDNPGAAIVGMSQLAWAPTAHLLLDRIATVGLAAVVVTLLVPFLQRWFGLAERVFLYSVSVWFALAAVAIITR